MNNRAVLSAQEAGNLETVQTRLVENIARWTEESNQQPSSVPGLLLFRLEAPAEKTSYMQVPSVCLIAQGSKRVMLGEDVYQYDAHHYLITSVGLPVVAQVNEASRENPYLGLKMLIDRRSIAQLMVDGNLPISHSSQAQRGMAVSRVSLPLLDAFNRLIELLDTPRDIPILAPLIQREILYRLLIGEQGARLHQIVTAGTHSNQIARALDWLQDNYTKLLHVEELASHAGMSASTFHQHFRSLTAMSPLQFQKWLRLHEARRLMFSEDLDAASASYQVGYESPSQFSREYSRLFGAPPLRDIKRIRQMGQGASNA